MSIGLLSVQCSIGPGMSWPSRVSLMPGNVSAGECTRRCLSVCQHLSQSPLVCFRVSTSGGQNQMLVELQLLVVLVAVVV